MQAVIKSSAYTGGKKSSEGIEVAQNKIEMWWTTASLLLLLLSRIFQFAA